MELNDRAWFLYCKREDQWVVESIPRKVLEDTLSFQTTKLGLVLSDIRHEVYKMMPISVRIAVDWLKGCV